MSRDLIGYLSAQIGHKASDSRQMSEPGAEAVLLRDQHQLPGHQEEHGHQVRLV